MELRRLWIFALVALAVLAVISLLRQSPIPASASNSAKRSPVIVELFTSEGCSSCPPADALLRRLDETQPIPGAEVIVLGSHVDYWNYIGWTDRFSTKQLTDRQREYGDSFNLDSVYTPQMVVDGRTELNGADESRVRKTITAAANEPKANISLTLDGDSGLQIRIDSLPPAKDPVVLLAVTETHLQSVINKGENGGRTLTHTGVVRDLRVLGPVKGSTFSANEKLQLDPAWKPSDLRAVVFIQEQKNKHIIGAASLMLSKQ
jgi:hypothetical protein